METNFAPDTILSILVQGVNQLPDGSNEVGIGLTLHVGGAVISGKLISNWQWMQRNRDVFAKLSPGGYALLFDDLLKSMKENRDEGGVARRAVEDLPVRYKSAVNEADPTAFIHLAEAKVFVPGQEGMPGNGMLWRGRLAEVDGWCFGLFGPVEVTGP